MSERVFTDSRFAEPKKVVRLLLIGGSIELDVTKEAFAPFGVFVGETIQHIVNIPKAINVKVEGVKDGKLYVTVDGEVGVRKIETIESPYRKERWIEFKEATQPTKSEAVSKEPKILDNIVFTASNLPKGKGVLYSSSERGRKRVVLKRNSKPPQPGVKYQVRVIEDTNPSDPETGQYVVEIVETEADEIIDVPLAKPKNVVKKQEGPSIFQPIEINEEEGTAWILNTEIKINQKRGKFVPDRRSFRHFTEDLRTLRVLEKIAIAVSLKHPLLLEGETATSKTSGIEYLAMLTGHEVARFNFNGQTDTSEMIGKYVPNDQQATIEFNEAIKNQHLLSSASKEILARAREQIRGLTLVESKRLAEELGMKITEWRWQDGIVVDAIKKGKWLILDEINLGEQQIRERLNSLLEKVPSLTLSENGGVILKVLTPEEKELYDKGELQGIEPIGEGFQVFGTMNPAEYVGRLPMSPAEKNRWVEQMVVPMPNADQYREMMNFTVFGEAPKFDLDGVKYKGTDAVSLFDNLKNVPKMREFIALFAKFYEQLVTMAQKREIGKSKAEKYIFTRRDILAFLEFIDQYAMVDRPTRSKMTFKTHPTKIVVRAMKQYILDKMSEKDDARKVLDKLDLNGFTSSVKSTDPKDTLVPTLTENEWKFKFA